MTDVIPAIDMWAPIVPARDVMAYVGEHFPLPQLGYLRVFWKGEPTVEMFRNVQAAVAASTSAVSSKVTPSSSARWIVAIASASSVRP